MTTVKRCSQPDCTNRYKARGLCSTHYSQLLRTGSTQPILRTGMMCKFEGCNELMYGHGYCRGHAAQVRRGEELKSIDGCTFPDCDRPLSAVPVSSRWCKGHLTQHARGQELRPLRRKAPRDPNLPIHHMVGRTCSVCGPIETKSKYNGCPNVDRQYTIRKKYGLTLTEWAALRERADSRCEICGAKTLMHVDHDHDTGKVRGLLCLSCNRGIGLFRDRPNLLRAAAAYLELHQR